MFKITSVLYTHRPLPPLHPVDPEDIEEEVEPKSRPMPTGKLPYTISLPPEMAYRLALLLKPRESLLNPGQTIDSNKISWNIGSLKGVSPITGSLNEDITVNTKGGSLKFNSGNRVEYDSRGLHIFGDNVTKVGGSRRKSRKSRRNRLKTRRQKRQRTVKA
jgi:hypothetical protein